MIEHDDEDQGEESVLTDQDLKKRETKERRKQRKESREAVRSPEESREALRHKVRMFYDLQRLRQQTSGRVTRKAEGAEIQLTEIDQRILGARFQELFRAEKNALADIEDQLHTMPIWTEVLSQRPRFKGLGPTMAGVILSEYDIRRLETPSQMWAFAGLAPIPSRRCKKCHVTVTFKEGVFVHDWKKSTCGRQQLAEKDTYASGKAKKPIAGEKLSYNKFLKTKMVGVLGGCLLKSNSPWRKFYDDYKHRKESAGWGMSDGHRHNAAIRYMIKMLLLEVWSEWRKLEGLPVRENYQEEYLGHKHAS